AVHRILHGEHTDDELSELAAHCSERPRAARLSENHACDRLKISLSSHDVSPQDELDAHVVHSGAYGICCVRTGWQCAAVLDSHALQKFGCEYDPKTRLWYEDQPLEPGHRLKVSAITVSTLNGLIEIRAKPAKS